MSQPRQPSGTAAIAAVIFDVDGVLVESPHEQAWRAALTTFMQGDWHDVGTATGYTPERFATAVYQRHVAGKPRLSGARAVLDYFSVPETGTRAVEYAERKQRLIEELIGAGAFEAFPDALRFCVGLHVRGVQLAAASSSKNANRMMAQVSLDAVARDPAVGNGDGGEKARGVPRTLLDIFAANVCGRDVGMGKPHPELFLLAAKELGVLPERCVVVEDAPAGVQAAKAGGMKAIGVARLDDAPLLQAAGADLVVTSLDQVATEPLIQGRLTINAADHLHAS